MARLIDADALMMHLAGIKIAYSPDERERTLAVCVGIEKAMDAVKEAPTAFDVKILMKKLATLDRIAKSDKQKALLGRVFLIIENMIEENEKEQNDGSDKTDEQREATPWTE